MAYNRFAVMTEFYELLETYDNDCNPDFNMLREDESYDNSFCWRLGTRTPEDFKCTLSVTGCKSKTMAGAIDYVLDRITSYSYEDAFKLQEAVEVVEISSDMGNALGMWKDFRSCARNDYYYEKYCLGNGAAKAGVIVLNSSISADPDMCKFVFAHECGHALDHNCPPGFWIEAFLSQEDFREISANSHVSKWGMRDIMEKVSSEFMVFDKFTKASRREYFMDYCIKRI